MHWLFTEKCIRENPCIAERSSICVLFRTESPVTVVEKVAWKPIAPQKVCKIKFRDIGIRVVYKPLLRNGIMTIIVVGIRSDSDAYIKANKRRKEYGL